MTKNANIPTIFRERPGPTALVRSSDLAPSPPWYDLKGRRERKEVEAQVGCINTRGFLRVYEHQVETAVQNAILELAVSATERETEQLEQLHGSTMDAVQGISERFERAAEASYRAEAAHEAGIQEEVASRAMSPEVARKILAVKQYSGERLRLLDDRATTSCLDVKMNSYEWVAKSRIGRDRV